MVWAGPASTDGGLLWVMVTLTESEEATVPSSAVSVKVTVVVALTRGAVKVVDGEVALASAMSREAGSWVHR